MTDKILTQLPIGKIKDFIYQNFSDIHFSEKALHFFQNEFIGKEKNTKEPIEIKDGNPSDLKSWLKTEFDIDMSLDGDYAIVAVLAILLEFKERAIFNTFFRKGKEYGSGIHDHVSYFKCVDRFKREFELYQLNLKNNDYKMFISPKKIELNHFEKNNKPLKTFDFQNPDNYVELTLPLVKFEENEDLSEIFKNSHMVKQPDNIPMNIDSVKTYAMIDLGLEKVEVKQAAAVCFVVAGGASIDHKIRISIEDDFYLYLQYKDDLIFATEMKKDDFIQGKELELLKLEEDY